MLVGFVELWLSRFVYVCIVLYNSNGNYGSLTAMSKRSFDSRMCISALGDPEDAVASEERLCSWVFERSYCSPAANLLPSSWNTGPQVNTQLLTVCVLWIHGLFLWTGCTKHVVEGAYTSVLAQKQCLWASVCSKSCQSRIIWLVYLCLYSVLYQLSCMERAVLLRR